MKIAGLCRPDYGINTGPGDVPFESNGAVRTSRGRSNRGLLNVGCWRERRESKKAPFECAVRTSIPFATLRFDLMLVSTYVKSAPAQELVAGSKNTRADAQEMDSFYTNKVQKL